MSEHVILVAITVEADSREEAHRLLVTELHTIRHSSDPDSPIDSWWVAEDDRIDGSDCDSAIFVPRGSQSDMQHVLNNYFDAHEQEWDEDGYPYAASDVSGAWFKPEV